MNHPEPRPSDLTLHRDKNVQKRKDEEKPVISETKKDAAAHDDDCFRSGHRYGTSSR